ncbi:hypothetical protein B0H17DRAFT_1208405 [Mycena rosella]|uniref:Uncharacterized protein n=1 Tax=Mycena rosella TaxID=1033263 RepID=A0AAD7D0S7_MYCRO|nr:hypothetical protein B0H17DRAFT_1208405 [Mycena rosella]
MLTVHSSHSWNTHAVIRYWMAQTEDAIMEDAWDDSPSFIEDRSMQNNYLQCKPKSYWGGSLPHLTFVFGIHAPLTGLLESAQQADGPVPCFGSFTKLDDYPGDIPVNGGNPNSGRSTPGSRSLSGSTSDDSHHYVPAQLQREVNRHRSITEPYYIDERTDHRPHYDGRPPYAQGPATVRERNRFNDYSIYNMDHARARKTEHEWENINPASPHIIESPSPSNFPHGPDGHPQSPWAVRQNGDAPPDKFLSASGVITTPSLLDEQAYNLVAFLDLGQEEAYELFSTTMQNLGNFPTQFHTEGKAHLMCYQQELEKNWWICTTGAPRPPRYVCHPQNSGRTPRRPDAGSSGGSRYRILDDIGDTLSPTPVQPERSDSVWDTPNPRPAGPGRAALQAPPAVVIAPPAPMTTERRPVAYTDAACAQGYLGNSPPDPANEVPLSALDEFPSLALVPNTRWTASKLNNRHWRIPPMQLFSIPGLYEHLVHLGAYKVTSLAMQHYPYVTDSVTIFLVVTWFAQHGIVPGSRDISALENFCCSRWNMEAGIENLDNAFWDDEPQSTELALQITSASVPHWSELNFGQRRLAGTDLGPSSHTPMTGVVGGAKHPDTTPSPPV